MNERIKVYAYITRGTELLIFEERGFPEGGLQVPGGTPELGEDPESAALREAAEETGLEGLQMNRYLGEELFDVSIYGLDEIHRRKFYHILYDEDTPMTWTHIERDPSIITKKTPDVILFEFRWWDLNQGKPQLQAGFDAKLDEVMNEIVKS